MKQGQATTSSVGATKQEPQSCGVNPGGASQIGGAQGRMAMVQPIYEGRGLEAPRTQSTIHNGGSQGKHR